MRRRRSLHAALVAGFLPALLHCGASSPEVRHYTLSLQVPQNSTSPAPQAQGAGKTLLIQPLSVREPYQQDRMVYCASPFRVDYYNYHQWASTPSDMVTEWTLRYLRGTGLFGQVVTVPGAAFDLVLGGVIRDFEEVDKDTGWEAVLAVDFWLARGENQQPVWFRSYRVSHPAARRNPESIAAAMSQNLEQVLQQVAGDLAAFAR